MKPLIALMTLSTFTAGWAAENGLELFQKGLVKERAAGNLHPSLSWSPDGRWLRYRVMNRATGNSSLWRISAEGGQNEKLGDAPGVENLTLFKVNPSGTEAVFSNKEQVSELWTLRNYLGKMTAPTR